ncbi:hypothetical protein [Geothermobacter ehrlichii]|nr:hypothetical protein [Geothermobacter ehrlichii]
MVQPAVRKGKIGIEKEAPGTPPETALSSACHCSAGQSTESVSCAGAAPGRAVLLLAAGFAAQFFTVHFVVEGDRAVFRLEHDGVGGNQSEQKERQAVFSWIASPEKLIYTNQYN